MSKAVLSAASNTAPPPGEAARGNELSITTTQARAKTKKAVVARSTRSRRVPVLALCSGLGKAVA
jgi:hypothetical protein